MGDIFKGDNGRRLVLTPRSGSHALVAAWLQQREPQNYAAWLQNPATHPAVFLAYQEISLLDPLPEGAELGVVVRNPVERFRSMISRHVLSVDEQLVRPMYGPLPQLPYTQFFRFEDGLQECAEWLGIATPIAVVAESNEDNKPSLTAEQEARVREIYAADIALWESLA